jgi:hypothetical protein
VEELGQYLGIDPETWQEGWFSPTDALPTIRGLLDYYYQSDPNWFNQRVIFGRPCYLVSELIAALESFEKALLWAEKHGVRFHFN